MPTMAWASVSALPPRTYVCGYCSNSIGSDRGFTSQAGHHQGLIYICPICDKPTFFRFASGERVPGERFGQPVAHVPDDVTKLYEEARTCCANNAYTGAVLLCRKLLMNIAVSCGAKGNLKFIEYVEYLAANGYVPPNGKSWVDHIRQKGNEATHEILLMGESDARDLITFSEMLLKFIFEFPQRVPAKPAP
jgi:hypothetical protein